MGARRGLLVAGLGAGLLLAADRWLAPVPLPPAPRGAEPTSRADLAAAFARPRSVDDPLVERFRAGAVRLGDRRGAAIELFDAERLTLAAGALAPAEGVYAALARGLPGGTPDWAGATVCRVEPLPGGRDVVASVRHPGGPARWWLVDSGTAVTAYDFEDCRVGVRLSELLAAGRDPATADSTALALAALNDPDADWDAALEGARAVPVRVLLRLSLAARALRGGDASRALSHADAADAERPGMPAVDLVRFSAYLRRGDAARAGEARQRYEAVLGAI